MKQQQTEDAEDRRKRSTKKRGTDRKAKRREEVLGKGGEKKPRAHMREQRAASSDDRSYRPTWPNPETLKFFGAWVFSYSYPLLVFLGCLIGALLLYNHLVLWALQGFSFGVFFFFLRLAGVRLLSHASNTSGDTTRLAQQFHLVFLQAHLMSRAPGTTCSRSTSRHAACLRRASPPRPCSCPYTTQKKRTTFLPCVRSPSSSASSSSLIASHFSLSLIAVIVALVDSMEKF